MSAVRLSVWASRCQRCRVIPTRKIFGWSLVDVVKHTYCSLLPAYNLAHQGGEGAKGRNRQGSPRLSGFFPITGPPSDLLEFKGHLVEYGSLGVV